ncbi:MAG: rhodanese-like domain-containing protein [Pseudomonadota bacterium]
MLSESRIDEVTPDDALQALIHNGQSALVDVRTRAEWAFVGLPDIGCAGKSVLPVEWVTFPTMTPNSRFMEQLEEAVDGSMPDRLFFICRSGARSMAAARAVAAEMDARGLAIHCTNVAEGFEGDLDSSGHRGRVNGWKARGLAWRQN